MMESNNLAMNIHHIGYAISDLNKAIETFRSLGYSIGQKTIDDDRKVAIVFTQNGNENIELIAPIAEDSPVTARLKKIGPGPYHICYGIHDIHGQIKKMQENGWMIVQEPALAPAINNHQVAFLFHIDIGLIELVELPELHENSRE